MSPKPAPNLAPPAGQPVAPQSTLGSVLIIVLWVAVGLTAITLTLAHSMIMTYRSADNELAGRQAQQAIEGVARYVVDLLAAGNSSGVPGEMLDQTSYYNEAAPLGEATFWILGQPDESDSSNQPVFGLVDEASKININTATVGVLTALPGMTEELAAAIIDWRDADDDITSDGSVSGAESETYMLRSPAYAAKNKPFESIEELALVNGATYEILYGEDANLNGLLDPNEDDRDASAPADNGDGKLEHGILQYLTCFSRESNKRSDGTPRFNVGARILDGGLQVYMATKGIDANRVAEITAALATSPEAPNSVLDFYVKGALTATEIASIIDDIYAVPTAPGAPPAATAPEFVEGLINVNTASETVLSCIPGIGTDNASTLVASRTQQSSLGSNIAWVVDVLGKENVAQYGRFLTGRVSQVSADIAAVGRNGRGYRRTKFVIDTTPAPTTTSSTTDSSSTTTSTSSGTPTPRIIYRRDLSSLGWALGSQARQDLALQRGNR